MNVKANKRIAELPEVDSFEAFPFVRRRDPVDRRLLPGSGQAIWRCDRQAARALLPGRRAAEERCAGRRASTAAFTTRSPPTCADAVARLLAAGQPVARCAGPMEFGARRWAIARSWPIPKSQDVVRVINRMVKKRDFWMPFAPMVKEERQHDYIQNPKNLRSPFMMMTFDTKENFRDLIAAVHNADLTCRAQILSREQNPAHARHHQRVRAPNGRRRDPQHVVQPARLSDRPHGRTRRWACCGNSGLEYLQVGDYLVSQDGPCRQQRSGRLTRHTMAEATPDFAWASSAACPPRTTREGRLVCNHSIGRLLDMFREMLPGREAVHSDLAAA